MRRAALPMKPPRKNSNRYGNKPKLTNETQRRGARERGDRRTPAMSRD